MNKDEILKEVTKLAKSNNDIGKYGDGYEKAINEAIQLVKNCSIPDVVERSELLRDYFAWHKEKGYVSHKPSDIDEFINEQ